jgi:hypothetical protein
MKTLLIRALHAEAAKRGLDHDGLRDVCRVRFSVASMRDLSDGQLKTLFRDWTGRNFVRKRTTPLPKRGYGRAGELELVSGEDLETLGRAFAARQWGPETQRAFIRRQLGRDQIRTRRDFHRVFSGVRAMNRRDGL